MAQAMPVLEFRGCLEHLLELSVLLLHQQCQQVRILELPARVLLTQSLLDLAYECINSVPFESGAAVELMDSIRPYLDWQTTLQYVKDPPGEYVAPSLIRNPRSLLISRLL